MLCASANDGCKISKDNWTGTAGRLLDEECTDEAASQQCRRFANAILSSRQLAIAVASTNGVLKLCTQPQAKRLWDYRKSLARHGRVKAHLASPTSRQRRHNFSQSVE